MKRDPRGERATAIALRLLVALVFLALVNNLNAQDEFKRLQESDFASAQSCGQCHREIYQQWSTSMHSRSFTDPLYRAVFERMVEQNGRGNRVFCLSCHSPVATVAGTTLNLTEPIDWGSFSPIAAEGVTCDFCHTISGPENLGKDIRSGALVYPRRGRTAIKYGRNSDAQTPAHGTETSSFLTTPEFCATCHQFKHPISLVEVQNTYDEWQQSDYAKKGVRCQDCHMPPSPGKSAISGPSRDAVHSHAFSGGHTKMIQKAATLELTGRVTKTGFLEIAAEVVNSGAGHAIPTGVPGLREIVLRVRVTAGAERLAEESHSFAHKLLTRKDDQALPWETYSRVEDDRIPPQESRTIRFSAPLPPGFSGEVSIEGELYLHLLRDAVGRSLNLNVPEPLLITSSTKRLTVP